MLPDPLHPAIVHMPLALAILLPVAVLIALWAIYRSGFARPIWAVVVLMMGLLVVSARVAIQTGESQEEAVEEVVTHEAIHEHEEAGEGLFLVSTLVLIISALGLVGGRVGNAARPLMLAGAIAIVVAALRVGESGGALVYEHGAASAYTVPTPPTVVAKSEDPEH